MFDYRMAKGMQEERLKQAESRRMARQVGIRFGPGAMKWVVAVATTLMVAAAVTATLVIL